MLGRVEAEEEGGFGIQVTALPSHLRKLVFRAYTNTHPLTYTHTWLFAVTIDFHLLIRFCVFPTIGKVGIIPI